MDYLEMDFVILIGWLNIQLKVAAYSENDVHRFQRN